MSSIKLKHSGGNSVSLNPPTSAPTSSDVAFKLPNADGSSGQYMKTDGSGNLSFATAVAGISMMDQWRITSDNSKNGGDIIDSGWERNDTYFAQIGSGMTESSGVFTFPSTGIYLIMSQLQMHSSADYAGIKLEMSANSGSSYNTISYGLNKTSGYSGLSMHAILDVTDASTHRLRMQAVNNSSTQYSGGDYHRTGLTFIRLGDT